MSDLCGQASVTSKIEINENKVQTFESLVPKDTLALFDQNKDNLRKVLKLKIEKEIKAVQNKTQKGNGLCSGTKYINLQHRWVYKHYGKWA